METSHSNSSMIQEFIRKVESLHEVEYGDFKRKVGQYVNRLEQRLTDPQARSILDRIRYVVVYDPPHDTLIAREETLALAQQLLASQTVH